jgi:hypothetical protein
MNKERLSKLADFVEANAVDNKFSMRSFFSRDAHKAEDLRNKCGTTACLAGWGCIIPEFNREGYSAVLYDVTHPEYGIVPTYNGKMMFDALENFFDLNAEQAQYLFGEYDDRGETLPRDKDGVELAVSRIRNFIATGKVVWEEYDSDYCDEED